MFISNDAFEVPFPQELSPRGGRFFRAVELSDRSAWYLVTFYATDDPCGLLHTFCCSWDLQILNWLNSGPRFVITAVQQMQPTHGANAGWEMSLIRRIWTAEDEEGRELLIFEDDLGNEYEGLLAERPTGPLSRRTLVAELSVSTRGPRTQSGQHRSQSRKTPRKQPRNG